MTLGIDIAEKYIGLEEVKNNLQLRQFFQKNSRNVDIDINPETTSWCAAFINACERTVGNKGTGKLNAQSFNIYGTEISSDNIQRGDILVFHFPFDSSWQGHVTYFDSKDASGNLNCLGGNQDNSVKYSIYDKQYLKHIRRP